MQLISSIINPLLAIISILTSTGVFLHDTQIDKAAVTAIAHQSIVNGTDAPVATFQKGDPHTHSERGPLGQALRELKAASPRTQPRRDEERHSISGERPFRNAFDTRGSLFDSDYLS